MWKRWVFSLVVMASMVLAITAPVAAGSDKTMIGVNVVLKTDITNAILTDLAAHGTVRDVVYEIKAITLQARAGELAAIRALPYVASANPDATRNGAPVDTVAATNFADGLSTWDMDAINVTEFGFANRQVAQDGTGVYVAVLDTGLLDSWRQYFPQERIATQFAKAFNGGGGENGNVSEPTNKWEHDQNSHGTHVTSTILGYSLNGTPVNGVAPMATIIPVKVLNQNGSGWSSVVARGITYVTDLKVSGALGSKSVVINMSLGGPTLDSMEKAAVDYAVANGVIVVAAAGNEGEAGMGYPGAYGPVISVAATGYIGEWYPAAGGAWWYQMNPSETAGAAQYYITDFSSRQKAGQQLDVAAPGSWIVGPYQTNSGQTSYYFLGGTSMATPHVAGLVALMVQKDNSLTAAQAESILKTTALPLGTGCRNVYDSSGAVVKYCWGADATGSGMVLANTALAATPSIP